MPTLDWIGKDKVINHHFDVPYRVLDEKYNYGDESDYIVWHNFVNFAHDSRENKEEIMLNYAINYPMTETNAMIPNRPATP